MKKHYVEFMDFRGLYNEKLEKEIKKRTLSCITIPKKCIGYRFFDKEEYNKDGVKFLGDKENISPRYFIGIEYNTLAQVEEVYLRMLYDNCHNQNYSFEAFRSQCIVLKFLRNKMAERESIRIVKTVCNTWRIIKDDDIVLNEKIKNLCE